MSETSSKKGSGSIRTANRILGIKKSRIPNPVSENRKSDQAEEYDSEKTIKNPFWLLFGAWFFFIGTIVFFFVAISFYPWLEKQVSELTAKKAPEVSVTPPPVPTVSDTPKPVVTPTPVPTVHSTPKPVPNNIFQLKDISPKKLDDGGIQITVFTINTITDKDYEIHTDSINIEDNPVYYIDFLGNWKEPEGKLKRYPIKHDIVKSIRIDRKSNKKMRLSVYLKKKIQEPDVVESPEGLIITIKSSSVAKQKGSGVLPKNANNPAESGAKGQKPPVTEKDANNPAESGANGQKPPVTEKDANNPAESGANGQKPPITEKDANNPAESDAKGQKTPVTEKDANNPAESDAKGQKSPVTQKDETNPTGTDSKIKENNSNQIVAITKDDSKGIFRIIVLTNSPINQYKPSLSNGIDPKFYIVFKGKWEDTKTQYKPEDGDIVKAIKINNQSPDKIILVFDLTENIQFPSIEKSSQGLIITISKLE